LGWHCEWTQVRRFKRRREKGRRGEVETGGRVTDIPNMLNGAVIVRVPSNRHRKAHLDVLERYQASGVNPPFEDVRPDLQAHSATDGAR
jgi:hypothetical protein